MVWVETLAGKLTFEFWSGIFSSLLFSKLLFLLESKLLLLVGWFWSGPTRYCRGEKKQNEIPCRSNYSWSYSPLYSCCSYYCYCCSPYCYYYCSWCWCDLLNMKGRALSFIKFSIQFIGVKKSHLKNRRSYLRQSTFVAGAFPSDCMSTTSPSQCSSWKIARWRRALSIHFWSDWPPSYSFERSVRVAPV